MNENDILSVCLITYNHEKFVAQAIESILMQETNFQWKLVIADDCSTDSTRVIVSKYKEKFPEKIHLIYQETNVGPAQNFIDLITYPVSKYIAYLEGDDYWTDPYKLQKQVDFLEANPDYVLSFHKVKVLKPSGEIIEDFITKVPDKHEKITDLASLGNYIHSPTVVFRNNIIKLPEEYKLSPIGDYFLYMLLAEHGKLKYFDKEMAVYRYGVGIHSTHTQIKMAKANFKLFTLLLSYFNNPKINQILLDRQLNAFDNLENLIRSEYAEAFVSHHVFFKALQSLKHPGKFWRKLKNKLN